MGELMVSMGELVVDPQHEVPNGARVDTMGTILQGKGAVVEVSVVIPAYNSEGTLADLVRRLDATLRDCCLRHEVILVNDGSRDASWERICNLVAEYPNVRGINLIRNFGQHNAI